MTRYDNFHSRLVAWLKVVLPLVALAILSNLFLVSRTIDPADAIPYAKVDVADRVRKPRLTTPTWAGVTEDGSALTLSAAEVTPGHGGETDPSAEAMSLRMETPDGAFYELQAAEGSLDIAAQRLEVVGGVTITTSAGYRIAAPQVSVALDRTNMTAASGIAATAPMGQIEAGAMEIREEPLKSGHYLLVFNHGVKLLYRPQK